MKSITFKSREKYIIGTQQKNCSKCKKDKDIIEFGWAHGRPKPRCNPCLKIDAAVIRSNRIAKGLTAMGKPHKARTGRSKYDYAFGA